MSIRRFLAVAIALSLLLPSAVALAITVHLAWEHGAHRGESAFVPAADHHEAAGHAALLAVAEHGHSHAASDPDHEHSAAAGQEDSAARRAAAPLSLAAEPGAAAVVCSASRCRLQGTGLPPICGPPLLALLSILRI